MNKKLIDILYLAIKNGTVETSIVYLGRKANLNIVVDKIHNWLYCVSIKDLTSFKIIAFYDDQYHAIEFAVNLKNKTEDELSKLPCVLYKLRDPKILIKERQDTSY